MRPSTSLLSVLGVAAVLAGGTVFAIDSAASATEAESAVAKSVELSCAGDGARSKPPQKKEHIRRSAQRGLKFLTAATIDWQTERKCMGCHVQGVTAEALSVGVHHQYDVDDAEIKEVFRGLLDLPGGVRSAEGHAASGSSLRASTRAFGGASLARYDQWVSEDYGDDLITAATDLLEYQSKAGDIPESYNTGVVAKGTLQGTYQAIQTWQQAYARSADDRWLTAVGKAEEYLQGQVDAWYETPPGEVQHVNYALLGLLAGGVGSTEKVAVDLRDRLLESQNEDGGFPLVFGSEESSVLASGQTLYALRRLGMNDSDKAVAKAVDYLVETQQRDGGWSDSGAEKAEAMWAVLGLVSTDVLSVNVVGLKNGQHVAGVVRVMATAIDNEGTGVQKIMVSVDDIAVGGSCGDSTTYELDARTLEAGMHTIDVTAVNKDGKEARRRLTVYAGDHYLTRVGTKYADGGTLFSVRDIAPTTLEHDVQIEVLQGERVIYEARQKGEQGALAFHWKGETKSGDPATPGDYIARLTVRAADGSVKQTHSLPFVHDTPEVQAANYAQVAGKLNFAASDKDVENATVELVDDQGNVVQSTRSTASGQYRFRNVESKRKYKVRVRKKGWEDKEADLAPAAAEEAQADFEL